ncbi:MAG: BON domain-containing protein [Halieaceae bacterium]
MTLTRLTLLFFTLISLTGCGSFLSSIGSEPIKDNPGERTYGARVEDEAIETKSKVNINASDEGFKSSHWNVISYNAYVLLVGQVPNEQLKQKASDVVREVRSVRRIYNELEVAGNTSSMTRSSDTWLTTKVKSTLLASSEIEGNRVKVVTENGVIYLMGLVSRTEAARIAEVARSSQGAQKVVQIFEYID